MIDTQPRNGTVERSTVLQLHTFTPETRTIEIDGTPYEAHYVKNRRAPLSVLGELSASWQELAQHALPTGGYDQAEWVAHMKRCALATVPGLDYETLECLQGPDGAGPDTALYTLLVTLGVIVPLEGAESTDPPEAAAASTGEPPLPTWPDTTD